MIAPIEAIAVLLKAELDWPFDMRLALLRMRGLTEGVLSVRRH
jgi:hypothetical protein